MKGLGIACALVLTALVLSNCSRAKYVPVCSEHGGVKTVSAPDHLDDFYTRDVMCKDGISQRPEQVEDPSGKSRLVVPSEH